MTDQPTPTAVPSGSDQAPIAETPTHPTMLQRLNSLKLVVSGGLLLGGMAVLGIYDQAAFIEISKQAANAGLSMLLMFIGYRIGGK